MIPFGPPGASPPTGTLPTLGCFDEFWAYVEVVSAGALLIMRVANAEYYYRDGI